MTKEKLKQLFMSTVDEMGKESLICDDTTVWDVFLHLVKGLPVETYLLYLEADFPILQRVAQGRSSFSIASELFITSKDVYSTAKLWGMSVPVATVDFNPLSVYRNGITFDSFRMLVADLSAVRISDVELNNIFNNVVTFKNLENFLEDETNGQ